MKCINILLITSVIGRGSPLHIDILSMNSLHQAITIFKYRQIMRSTAMSKLFLPVLRSPPRLVDTYLIRKALVDITPRGNLPGSSDVECDGDEDDVRIERLTVYFNGQKYLTAFD